MSKYYFMHKNIPVAEVELDENTGIFTAVKSLGKTEHLPVGVRVKKDRIDKVSFNDWWKNRTIPDTRAGIRKALQELQVSRTELLPQRNLGLSLSDAYWICPLNPAVLTGSADQQLTWSQVNFFENPFSEDVGKILFGETRADLEKKAGKRIETEIGKEIGIEIGKETIDFRSPDNTTDGWLKKKWVILDGKRCLLKSGSGLYRQEVYNEILATEIMRRLGIPHVPYWMLMIDGEPYSVCEDFLTSDTELVTAWQIIQSQKKPNHLSFYQHYLNCCEQMGISGVRESLDQMMVLDYLIANEDRHLNNFGVIRHVESLEFMGAAPVYDSGTSFWFDKETSRIRVGGKIVCKPFKTSHEEQIRLVSDFSWIDFGALAHVEEEFQELVKDSPFVTEDRCDALCRGLRRRIEALETVAAASNGKKVYVDSTAFDVKKNVAYSGKVEEWGMKKQPDKRL